MDGFVNVLKPPGMTSHDVVAQLRRLFGMKKIGHTGTLDPGVAGVLPVCLGKATRLAEYITELPKSYRAEITFGLDTDTQDAYGQLLRSTDCSALSYEDFLQILPSFTGPQEQLPPMTSAVKIDGKPLYESARAGLEIARAMKKVNIYQIVPRHKNWTGEHPRAVFDVTCSKGTYIRTLCHDMGNRLNVGAMMSFLIRTVSGPFSLAESSTLEEIAAKIDAGDFSFVVAMADGLSFLPMIEIDLAVSPAVINGNPVRIAQTDDIFPGIYRAQTPSGELIAMGELSLDPASGQAVFQPGKVFADQSIG